MKITIPIALALLAVYLLWGGTYLAMKVAVETIPPFTLSGIRFLIAGGIVYVWQIACKTEKPKAIEFKNTAVVGIIMLLGGNAGIVWSEQYVSSGIAAVIFAMVPFWVTLLSWLWQGSKRPNAMVFGGLSLGMMGVYFLVKNSIDLANISGGIGYITLIIASFFWAVGALYSRTAQMPSAPFMAIALQMLTGGVACLFFGFFMGEWMHLNFALISFPSILALGYLILFGSIIGFSAYIWLLKVTDPILVTTNTYVNPVVAVILGWLLAGEQIGINDALAAIIILLSVIIINKANNQGKRDTP